MTPRLTTNWVRAYGHLQRPTDRKKAMGRFAQLTGQSQKLLEAQREVARLTVNVQQVIDRGDNAKALQMMERAHDLDPNNDEVVYRLGGLYLDEEKYDLARTARKQSPSGPPLSGATGTSWDWPKWRRRNGSRHR